jgi:transposase
VADVPLAEDAIALRAANARLRGVVEAKDTENAVLRAQLEAYQAQLEELPSAEGLAKPAPRSLRAKSGRKPGRPKGQPGATLEMSDHPDDSSMSRAGAVAAARGCPARRSRGWNGGR